VTPTCGPAATVRAASGSERRALSALARVPSAPVLCGPAPGERRACVPVPSRRIAGRWCSRPRAWRRAASPGAAGPTSSSPRREEPPWRRPASPPAPGHSPASARFGAPARRALRPRPRRNGFALGWRRCRMRQPSFGARPRAHSPAARTPSSSRHCVGDHGWTTRFGFTFPQLRARLAAVASVPADFAASAVRPGALT
jgi:hypothetical protein